MKKKFLRFWWKKIRYVSEDFMEKKKFWIFSKPEKKVVDILLRNFFSSECSEIYQKKYSWALPPLPPPRGCGHGPQVLWDWNSSQLVFGVLLFNIFESGSDFSIYDIFLLRFWSKFCRRLFSRFQNYSELFIHFEKT